MIKSIYFMFFVCACLFGLFACSAKAQDKFKIYLLMTLKS